jgi:hypothetical protein
MPRPYTINAAAATKLASLRAPFLGLSPAEQLSFVQALRERRVKPPPSRSAVRAERAADKAAEKATKIAAREAAKISKASKPPATARKANSNGTSKKSKEAGSTSEAHKEGVPPAFSESEARDIQACADAAAAAVADYEGGCG